MHNKFVNAIGSVVMTMTLFSGVVTAMVVA